MTNAFCNHGIPLFGEDSECLECDFTFYSQKMVEASARGDDKRKFECLGLMAEIETKLRSKVNSGN